MLTLEWIWLNMNWLWSGSSVVRSGSRAGQIRQQITHFACWSVGATVPILPTTLVVKNIGCLTLCPCGYCSLARQKRGNCAAWQLDRLAAWRYNKCTFAVSHILNVALQHFAVWGGPELYARFICENFVFLWVRKQVSGRHSFVEGFTCSKTRHR